MKKQPNVSDWVVICADAGSRRFVGEQAGAIVLIKRHAFVRKIADHQARKAGAIEVGRVRAHAGAHSARVAEGNADGHATSVNVPS